MQEIKDCPICKCKASLRCVCENVLYPYVIECGAEPNKHYAGFRATESEVIEDWNRWVEDHAPSDVTSDSAQATIRREILDEAARCVCGDRESEYGSPEDNFKLIAALWSAYLGIEITSTDVAMLMTMLKIARIKSGTMTRDSFVDAAGYIACGGEIVTRMEETDP